MRIVRSIENTFELGIREGVRWSGRIRKAGGGGNTGFITLPLKIVKNSDFQNGDLVRLNIIDESKDSDDDTISIDSQYRVNKSARGFYIPREVVNSNKLMGNKFNFSASKRDGFSAKISKYKQVIIPQNKLNEFQISDNDIINLTVETSDGSVIEEPVIVKYSNRKDRRGEHIAVFRNNAVIHGPANAKINGKLEKLLVDLSKSSEELIYLPNLFPGGHIGKLDEETGILFKGRHSPIEVPLQIDLGENTHYMGAYFADGTKQGHAWRMNASTPEQVMYYNTILEKLLPNEEFKYNVVYSKTPSDSRTKDEIESDIKNYWEENTDNSICVNKVYQLEASIDDATNRNDYGSLEIDNHKGLVMQFHQEMLDQTVKIIDESNDKELLWNFVHGILEGDGYVAGGSNRFGIGISCNVDNYQFIERILEKLDIQSRTEMSAVRNNTSNSVDIQFGLFEILKNFESIKNSVFQFYPKRADKFFDRIQNQATIKHLLGKQSDSNFVKGRSKEFDIDEIINFFKNRNISIN